MSTIISFTNLKIFLPNNKYFKQFFEDKFFIISCLTFLIQLDDKNNFGWKQLNSKAQIQVNF